MRPERLEFPPLNCTHDERLGDYYQDFSAAIELIESGYHGSIDERGVPRAWLELVTNSIQIMAPDFSAQRMVREYAERFYQPAGAVVTR